MPERPEAARNYGKVLSPAWMSEKHPLLTAEETCFSLTLPFFRTRQEIQKLCYLQSSEREFAAGPGTGGQTMRRLLLAHYDQVKKGVAGLGQASAFAFGASCAERSWSVYEHASAGRSWQRNDILRSNLDAIWLWLKGSSASPLVSASACEAAIPEESSELRDDLAFEVANNIFGLVALVEQDDPGHVYLAAQANLDLLDAFLYEIMGLNVSPENDAVIDNNSLMQAEIRRQLDDLAVLSLPANPLVVEQVRRGAEGIDLLGGWRGQGKAGIERG